VDPGTFAKVRSEENVMLRGPEKDWINGEERWQT
jgi:hypothetical protein